MSSTPPAEEPPQVRRSLPHRMLHQPLPNPRQAAMLILVALSVGVISGRALEPDGAQGAGILLADSAPAQESAASPATEDADGPALAPPAGNAEAETAPRPRPVERVAPSPAPPSEPQVEPSEPVEGEPPADQPKRERRRRVMDDEAPATTVSGTVVHVNPAARSYSLATPQGELVSVQSARGPEIGLRLEARVRRENDATVTEVRRAVIGSESSARLRGTVTFVEPETAFYTVSVPGTSLLIRSASDRIVPAVLDLVTVDVRLQKADPGARTAIFLTAESLTVEGRASGAVNLTGTVKSVDAGARTLLLSADDVRESGRDITIAVAPEVDLELLKSEETINAVVEIGADGSYRMTEARPAPNRKGRRAPG